MDPVNTSIDTSKPLSYDKLETIEQLHDVKHTNELEHGISKNYDEDDFLNLQKSPSNGLLDSYHENITPEKQSADLFEREKDFHQSDKPFSEDLIDQPNSPKSINSELQQQFSSNSYGHPSNEPFCGTDKLNNLADYLMNDDVEEFIPSSNIKDSNTSPLLDFDPLNEPVRIKDHDDFHSYKENESISPLTPNYPLPGDHIIEPVTEFKETIAAENFKDSDKFKEIIDDSPRTGTPDFLELDQDDLKPIEVKTENIKPNDVKPIDTKPIDVKFADTKSVDVTSTETKPIEKVPEKLPEVIKTQKNKVEYFQEKPEIGPKEIFSKYGLDIWFKPERLNPTVEAFIYWRDPKLSGIVFGSGLVLLLSMAYYSLISVVANTGLTILVLAMGFRIYKHVLQAVQKTDQGHPYSVFLEWDLKLPQEKVHELVDTVLIHINAYVSELRRLFLIENWMDSVRFAVVLWVLTYVGSWFNGLTLVIIAFVSLFTLPKVYENNKVQIDQNLALVHAKLEELTNKIKDVLPALLRKKLPEKKE